MSFDVAVSVLLPEASLDPLSLVELSGGGGGGGAWGASEPLVASVDDVLELCDCARSSCIICHRDSLLPETEDVDM